MRVIGALFVAVVVGCAGGGGGGFVPPAPVNFGIVAADAPTVRKIMVGNPFGTSSNVEAVAETGPFHAAAGALPAPASGGQDFELSVEFVPPAVGDFEGSVTIRFVPAGGGSPVEVKVDVRATAEAAIPSTPTPQVDFGDVLMTTSATRQLRFFNAAGYTSYEVSAPTLPAGFSFVGAIFPIKVPPRETRSVDLEYVPMAPGISSFDLAFPHDAGGSPLVIRIVATTSGWPEEMVTDLGSVPLDGSGLTPWLEVDVTPDTISFTVEATATSAETIELVGLEWPTGFQPSLPAYGLVWPTVKRGIRSVTVPWTDDPNEQLDPGAGTYKFRFQRESGTATSLKVRTIVENRPGGIVSSGTLDLNVFLIVGPGFTPEMAQNNAALQATLAAASTVLGTAGITIGDVAYYGIENQNYNVIGSVSDPWGTEIFQLFQETSVATDPRVNVFYVQSIYGAYGLAGMVQGPASNGWQESGVVISGFDNGRVTAHEVAHYLGLHHIDADAITDTAPATPGNVMGVSVAGPTFTSGQAHVILRHPLVRSP